MASPSPRLVRRMIRNMIVAQVLLAALFIFVTQVPFYAAMLFGVCAGVGAIDVAERQERRVLEHERSGRL